MNDLNSILIEGQIISIENRNEKEVLFILSSKKKEKFIKIPVLWQSKNLEPIQVGRKVRIVGHLWRAEAKQLLLFEEANYIFILAEHIEFKY